MKTILEKELESLNNSLIEMGTLIEIAIDRAITALKIQDKQLAASVAEYEHRVNAMEKSIESTAMRLLLSHQPVAKDLRLVSTALKLITDMERIADQAFDISEITIYLLDEKFIKEPDLIVEMALKTVEMVKSSLDAFVNQDEVLAKKIILQDDVVDDLFVAVRDDLVNLINEDKSNGEQAIDFIMVAKYLERIADHSVNICEWVIYYVTGHHSKNLRFEENLDNNENK